MGGPLPPTEELCPRCPCPLSRTRCPVLNRVLCPSESPSFQADQWVPTLPSVDMPTKLDTNNRLEIDAVQTTAIRLGVKLKNDFSGGILELRGF